MVTTPPATQSAEITFWTPNAPATPTEELQENLSRVNSCGPRDKNGPTLVNHRRGRYVIKVGGVQRILKANVVPMRKPFLVVGDMLTTGHDVHFTTEGCWTEHRKTGDVINFVRSGGQFETDVDVRFQCGHRCW